MSIILQFVQDDAGWFDPTDFAIQWYSHGWADHVDAVIRDCNYFKTDGLLGARMKKGVALRSFDYQKFKRVERVTVPMSYDQGNDFYGFLYQQLGKPYDDTAILGFAFDRDWRDHNHWMCSELMAAALEHCGFFPYPLNSPANRVTPTDLMLAISARTPIEAAHVR
jgi:hypothetical protein